MIQTEFLMKNTPQFKIGDWVTVAKLPANLADRADIDTLEVFKKALDKTFRVQATDVTAILNLW